MFLGIDIGTSEVKALLLDASHQLIGTAGASLGISRPHPGHSEQAPQDWWQATQAALAPSSSRRHELLPLVGVLRQFTPGTSLVPHWLSQVASKS